MHGNIVQDSLNDGCSNTWSHKTSLFNSLKINKIKDDGGHTPNSTIKKCTYESSVVTFNQEMSHGTEV